MSIESTTCLVLALIWIIGTILELSSLYNFKLNKFSKGIVIHRKRIEVNFSNWNDFDGPYQGKEGEYVFIPDAKVGYFITIYRFYKRYNLLFQTYSLPLTLFGTFKEENNNIYFEYRVSYRLLLLYLVWIIPWIIIPIAKGESTEIGVGLFGIITSTLSLYIMYLFNKRKINIMSEEVLDFLSDKE